MNGMSMAEKVKEFILEEIKAGNIASGQRLPSCREVGALLGINKITVNKAYAQLEKEHIIYCIPRGGFYLLDFEEKLSISNYKVDFSTVKPDSKFIPYREFTHVINKAVDLYKYNLFEYESEAGLLTLRETLKEKFEKDGIYTTSDNIVITNGAQQGIAMAFQTIFFNNNGKLLIEVPTYNLAIKLAEKYGIDMIGIERKNCGYDYNKLEYLFQKGDIAAFYIIPRHHNPTGYSLSEKDKLKIAELCNKYNVLIIEDDYLIDLGVKKGAMPIHYYDMKKQTIFIRSFSKTFMPGVRLGAAVIPTFMLERVKTLKLITDLNTSKLLQVALEIYIKSGMYEKQVKKVRKSYESKLRRAKEIFNSLQPQDILWNVPENGIFIWLQLPEFIEIKVFEEKLKKQGILIRPSIDFFLTKESDDKFDSNMHNYIRLCIAGVPDKDISALVRIISTIERFGDI